MGRKLSCLLGLLLICTLITGLFDTPASAAAKVKLSSTKKTLYAGELFTLELSNAKGTVKWSSSNKKVAVVEDGKVTAVKKGKATITAKDSKSGKSYKCKLTVKNNSLSNKKLKLKAGESSGLTLKGNTPAVWTSSDESIVYVSDGTVTALKKGSATITAKVGSKKYTCKVTVSENKTASTDPVELSLWVVGDPSAYDRAIEELKAAYPNVTVTCKSYENESYKDMIRLQFMAGDLPDIFYTWSNAFLGDFVEMDGVYCPNDVIKKYVANGDITKVMLENTTYDGKYYGVPLSMNAVVMYTNTDLLKQAGVKSVPKTYDELIDCCDKLLAKGITPFCCAGTEIWCITEYLESIIEKKIGADTLNKIFAGKASFDNKGILESVDLFKSMIKKGYFNDDILNADNGDISQRFINGDYAFYINGSWNCGTFANNAEFASKVAIAEFPVIDSKSSKTGQLIGGPSDALAISAWTKNPEVATEYAVALGKLVSKYRYLSGDGLPTWKIGYDDSGVNSLTKEVAKMMAGANGLVLYGDTSLKADEKNIYLEYVEKILSDDIDGKAFTQGLKKEIR